MILIYRVEHLIGQTDANQIHSLPQWHLISTVLPEEMSTK